MQIVLAITVLLNGIAVVLNTLTINEFGKQLKTDTPAVRVCIEGYEFYKTPNGGLTNRFDKNGFVVECGDG